MSVALRGNLKDFGIAEVFQLIGQQAKTGVLEVSGDEGTVELRFDRGAVVSAAPVRESEHGALGEMLVRCGVLTREKLEELEKERATTLQPLPRVAVAGGAVAPLELAAIDDLLTRETILELLRRKNGSFHFRTETVHHDRDRSALLGAEQILMDGLRMVDEWETFTEHVPSADVVFQRVGHFDVYRRGAKAETPKAIAAAERVFLLVDGRLPVRRVIDLSRLGSFEATRLLAELRRAGCIAPVDPEEVERARRRRRVAVTTGARRARPAVALGVPFGLLLVLLAAAIGTRREPAAAGGLAWRTAPIEEARIAIETRRVRTALEAHRLARGAWPDRLDELVEEGLLPPAALTPPSGRPYYYARHGEDFLLLTPER